MALERLIYESTATGTTGSLLNLATILAESQRNNDRDSLTGALAAHRERYIQVVEGQSAALDGLLKRLGKDVRHRDIVLLDRQIIAERIFANWSMASPRITPAMAPALDALMADPKSSGPRIIALLRQALNVDAASG